MNEIDKLKLEIEALTALKETYWNLYVAEKLKNEAIVQNTDK